MGDVDLDTVQDDLHSISKEDGDTPIARTLIRKISHAGSLGSTDNRDFVNIRMPKA